MPQRVWMTRQRAFRASVVVGGLALLVTLAIFWTGGGVFYVGGLRISSRGARNPALLTALSLVTSWLLAPSGRRTHAVAAGWHWLLETVSRHLPTIPRPAQVIAGIAVVATLIVGVTQGAFVVGGSDSYGYVSQGHLWVIGKLRQEPVLRQSLSSDIGLEVMSPLGYWPSVDGTTIAPIYSPGLPMVMAIFERVFGPASVFWVVPILGAVLVWATYLIGVRVQGPLVGALAAVLVATSPPFLMQLTAAPLSDLAAAAWWALALVLVSLDRRDTALLAGAAAGLAILTRPNLAPLAAIAGGLLIWRLVAARRPLWLVVQHMMLFAVFTAAACVVVAAVNRALWGSVFTSGYGSVSNIFSVANVWPNIGIYLGAIVTQMPVSLALPIVAFVPRRQRDGAGSDRTMTIGLWSFAAAVVLLYIAWPAFDASWNLRFLLPAISPFLVLVSVAMLSLAGRLVETHRAACVVVVLIICGYTVDYARDRRAFDTSHLQKFADIGESIAQRLPERAVLMAMLHSGSATYYSGRPTLRYDLLAPSRLDRLVEELTQRGYVPYLLIDADERDAFQSHYRGHSRLAALDWAPVVTSKTSDVQIYAIPAQP